MRQGDRAAIDRLPGARGGPAALNALGSHDWLGLVAGTLTTIAFVPQVVQIWRSRSARDISWLMFVILSTGVVLWLVWGIQTRSLPVIAANIVTLVLVFAILVLKWRYRR